MEKEDIKQLLGNLRTVNFALKSVKSNRYKSAMYEIKAKLINFLIVNNYVTVTRAKLETPDGKNMFVAIKLMIDSDDVYMFHEPLNLAMKWFEYKEGDVADKYKNEQIRIIPDDEFEKAYNGVMDFLVSNSLQIRETCSFKKPAIDQMVHFINKDVECGIWIAKIMIPNPEDPSKEVPVFYVMDVFCDNVPRLDDVKRNVGKQLDCVLFDWLEENH